MAASAQQSVACTAAEDRAGAAPAWHMAAWIWLVAVFFDVAWALTCRGEAERVPANQRAVAARPAGEAPTKPGRAAERAPQRAHFDAVVQQVQAHLTARLGYQPGDLISRREAAAILDCAAELGWSPPNRADILELVLDDRALLIRKLRKGAGKKLMRDCARRGLPFDTLDRLSSLPDGERILQSLINGPDGYKMIEYLATAPGGRALGSQLAAVPRGKDFNRPTGRIYTAEQLLAHLKQACGHDTEPDVPRPRAKP